MRRVWSAVLRLLAAPKSCALLLLLLLLAGMPAGAQDGVVPEQQTKAAYILNFARYASWPAVALSDPRAPLVMCMIGQGTAEIARQLQSRSAGSHPLELRNVSRVEDAESCHALYIGTLERNRQSAWLAHLRDHAILTIGDSASFLADGGMIHMMLVDGSIRFEVNLAASKHSGVSLHPRMLALAERVLGGGSK